MKMLVKLLVSRSHPTHGEDAGQEVEVSAAEARAMIDAGQAEPVKGGTSKPETRS
jgi:hypothetical protein